MGRLAILSLGGAVGQGTLATAAEAMKKKRLLAGDICGLSGLKADGQMKPSMKDV